MTQVGLFPGVANIETGARFSDDRLYRYSLWRIWSRASANPRLCHWLMLNPSTADERDNDPTVERCERRARRWDYDGLIVTNLFAWRATDPAAMRRQGRAAIGPDNDLAIWDARLTAALTICAWGDDGGHLGRAAEVLQNMATNDLWWLSKLHCLRVNQSGEPAHPLYLPYRLKPVLYART